MNLQEILEHRRAVRHFDPARPIDAERVKQCLEMAQAGAKDASKINEALQNVDEWLKNNL